MLTSTSRFTVKEIIFNDGTFAVATGYWDGGTYLRLACRWHNQGLGYPQTFGKPQWMMFPDKGVTVTCDPLSDLDKRKLVITLEGQGAANPSQTHANT